MKLNSNGEELSFSALQGRLLAFVHAKIINGDFSERNLAKMLGVSQPQLHNVLKGKRKLHVPLADALLLFFQLSIVELLSAAELDMARDNSSDLPPSFERDWFRTEWTGAQLDETERLRSLRKMPASAIEGRQSKRELG